MFDGFTSDFDGGPPPLDAAFLPRAFVLLHDGDPLLTRARGGMCGHPSHFVIGCVGSLAPRDQDPVSIGFSSFCSGPIGQNHCNLASAFRSVRNRPKAGHRENLSMAERWLSVQEIAAHLGVNRDTIYLQMDRAQEDALAQARTAMEVPRLRG